MTVPRWIKQGGLPNKVKLQWALLWCLGGALGACDKALALGGYSRAMAGANATSSQQTHLAATNPALLATHQTNAMSLGVVTGGLHFNPFTGIRTDSKEFRVESGRNQRGEVALESPMEAPFEASLELPFGLPGTRDTQAGFGLSFWGNPQKLRSFQAITPYEFYALRYGPSETQFQASMGLGVELVEEFFYLGAALSFHVGAAGDTDVTLIGENPTGRLALDVGLLSTLKLGAYFKPKDFEVGLVFHQGAVPEIRQQISARADLLGETSLGIPAELSSVLYFVPDRFELDLSTEVGKVHLRAGVSVQLWENYQPPVLELISETSRGRATQTSRVPLKMRSTVSPRISVEMPLVPGTLKGLAGWQFRPSPVVSLEGLSNLIDTDVHVVGAGVEWDLKQAFDLSRPLSLVASWQGHFLNSRVVEKRNPNAIGAPGYTIGGTGHYFGLEMKTSL